MTSGDEGSAGEEGRHGPGRVYARFEQWFERMSRRYAYAAMRLSLGVVFVWYGAQKPFIPGSSPVHRPVARFAEALGLGVLPGPTGLLLHAVGLIEVIVGTLLLFDFIRTVMPLFLLHQATTLVAPFVVMRYAFREPYVDIGPVLLPVAVDWFSAFALKNLVFVAAFMHLYVNHGERNPATSEPDEPPLSRGRT
ncbi:MAG: DoxX family membrane protein [Haloplanus sp.]